MKKKSFLIKCAISMVIVSFAFISCSKEMLENPEVESTQLSQFEKDKQIIASMGFNTDDMKTHERGYCVEGDIVVAKEHLVYPVTKQTRYNNFVDGNREYTIAAFSNLNSMWVVGLKDAINEWNRIPSCKIRLRYIGSSNGDADINCSPGYEFEGDYGWIDRPPSNGNKPGNVIQFNTFYDNSPAWLIKSIAIHEIGHCLGLYHTDYKNALFIPGTSSMDYSSIMNSKIIDQTTFSYYDIKACQTLWPVPLPPSDVRISINGGFYSANPVFSASGDLGRVVKYEWAVNGSTSISQSGSTVYVSTYPECTYLNVILTVTDTQGRKATFSRGFSRY